MENSAAAPTVDSSSVAATLPWSKLGADGGKFGGAGGGCVMPALLKTHQPAAKRTHLWVGEREPDVLELRAKKKNVVRRCTSHEPKTTKHE
jgi:mevalonate kinase